MKPLTVNFSEREMEVLEQLASDKDLSKTGILRQALRLYQYIDNKHKAGHRMLFDDEGRKTFVEIVK